MAIRVADRSTGRNYLKYLYKAKNDYAETNSRIASGNRFTMVSDDVSAGTQVLKARTQKYKTEKQLTNVKSAVNELATNEDTLTSISDILKRVHEVATKAQNDPTSESGRKAIKSELESLQKEILKSANVKIGSKYLFGGTASGTEPFSIDAKGAILYNGIRVDDIYYDAGIGEFLYNGAEIPKNDQMYIDAGLNFSMVNEDVISDSAIQVSYSGLDLLGAGTDSDGLPNNVYSLLTTMIDSLDVTGADSFDRETFEKAHDKLYNDTMDTFRENITDIGTKTNYLGRIQNRLEHSVDNFKLKIDGLMGISEEEESINLAQQDATYKAVLQIGSNILPMSLMDYIR